MLRWKKSIPVVCALAFPLLAFAVEPPVIEAVRSGDTARLRELVISKFALDARGSHKQTALHEAAAKCNPEATQLLVNAGVDRLIRDDANRTAAMIAMKCPNSAERSQLVPMLMVPLPADESKPWSLQDAAARGNINVVDMLLKMGSNVNAIGTKGNRALEVACRSGNVLIAKALLDHGADLRLQTTARSTVLHEAALGGNSEIIDVLLARGANINAVDESGATALHYAASFGRVHAVNTLIVHGAEINRRTNKGLTALDMAVANGQAEVITLLRAARQ